MQRQSWIPALLDCAGAGGLIGATVALGGARWFTDALPEGLFFEAFYVCFAVAVVTFAAARVLGICAIVARTPDPRRLRKLAAVASTPQADFPFGDEPRPSKLPRAA